ncbi:DUF2062 domain-containing protein [Aneurinibacillus terranovensis]|uniref:DUF2062 domain-containing protein n=1 Tax=Aneurinibacillus terranovensis TaxID=278991 RepID=UPI0003F6E1A4|nr:DUF2062 domain-containing protein [Aneurinibacillus terranovensis]
MEQPDVKSYTFPQRVGRKIKHEYYKLIRNKGALSIVARSFAIGLFIEFVTLPTFGIAFLALFPLIRLFGGITSIALIGFLLGKVILPVFFYLNFNVGRFLIGRDVGNTVSHELHHTFSLAFFKEKGLALLMGSFVDGLIMAGISYFVVYFFLLVYRKRKERQTKRKTSR